MSITPSVQTIPPPPVFYTPQNIATVPNTPLKRDDPVIIAL